jgi:hypothetical protein
MCAVAIALVGASWTSEAQTADANGKQPAPPVVTPAATAAATTETKKSALADPQPIDDKARWMARTIERSNARWKLIAEGKFDDAYQYITAAGRALLTPEQHAAQMRRLAYVDGIAFKADCDAQVCTVDARANIMLQIPRLSPRPQQVFLEEQWVRIDNEMWLLRK